MNKSARRFGKVLIILVLVLMVFLALVTLVGSVGTLYGFLDLRIMVFTIVPVILFLIFSDLMSDYIVALKFFFGSKEFTTKELKASIIATKLSIKAICITGGLGTIVGIMALLTNLSDPSIIGPYTAISLISIIYALVINLFQVTMKHKLEKELMYRGSLKQSHSSNNIDNQEIDIADDEDMENIELIENLNLTRRENEIYELLVKGNSNRMISEELCIAETTIKKHIQNI